MWMVRWAGLWIFRMHIYEKKNETHRVLVDALRRMQ
jgi:hypothetical protein